MLVQQWSGEADPDSPAGKVEAAEASAAAEGPNASESTPDDYSPGKGDAG